MLHIYTYGRKSRQFLILTSSQAGLLNEFTTEFYIAQDMFRAANGRQWTPSDTISFRQPYADVNLKKYNRLTKTVNLQHKIRNWLFTLFRINVANEEVDEYLQKRI